MRESNRLPEVLRITALLGLGLVVGIAPDAAVAQTTCGTAPACVGDCNQSGDVTVDEVVIMVNAALSGGDGGCPAGDEDSSGSITVDEIVKAVNNALGGCGDSAGLVDPGEECDDGGLCVGGANAGDPCSSEDNCEGDGACFGGLDDLRGCRTDDDCREGTCRKCRPYGGDGCAANCTIETDNEYALVPGQIEGTGDKIVFGTSGAVVFSALLTVPLQLTGSQVLTTGKIAGGQAPVVLKASGINLPGIAVSTIACACVRGAAASTCGGTLYDADGVQSANCTPGFSGIATCPGDKKCAAVHGPGNTGSGFITCGGNSVEIDVTQDCNPIPGAEPFDPIVTVTSVPPPVADEDGSAFLVITSAIGTVVGPCSGTTADYGPDGQFCTDDDPTSNRGTPNSIPFTTAHTQGTVVNPGDFEDILGPFDTMGTPFTCNGDLVDVHGTNLAGVFTSCDQPTVNDIVVVVNFAAQ